MQKPILIVWGGLLLLILTIYNFCTTAPPTLPSPSGGIIIGEEEGHSERRLQWLDQMHRAAPGISWRLIESERRLARHYRQQAAGRSDCLEPQPMANGRLLGRWIERGSSNQAGSVYDTEYDFVRDRIWLISAGGTLWSGPSDGSDWRVEQQGLQFDRGMLRFIPMPDGRRRLLAFTGSIPHYSDDEAASWSPAAGLPRPGRDAGFRSPTLLDEHSYFVFYKSDFYEPVTLYRSTDRGESFQPLLYGNDHHLHRYTLCNPHHTDSLFMARKTEDGELRLQLWDRQLQVFKPVNLSSPLSFGQAPANLIGGLDSLGRLQLYLYTEAADAYRLYNSDTGGKTWQLRATLPTAPWEVGIYLSPDRSGTLYLGDIEAYRSRDNGQSWQKINEWWEYYDDIAGALHADIMDIRQFSLPDGQNLTLISHHGGLSTSYDGFDTQQNISLQGLHVSQYYSIRTDIHDPNYVYAGSQDQGLQRSRRFAEEPQQVHSFEQLISGDYGQIVFTRAGTAMWSVYPGGWITYYDEPREGYVTTSYELESEDESVWLPPLMPSPFPLDNAVYMAGGNIEKGPGSYLIRLEYRDKSLHLSQLPFNFKEESGGGVISAMATAPGRPAYWYATTTNGRFFHSRDSGNTWQQSLNFVPEGHYLYGQAIHVSASDPLDVVLAGSGYSNPPVYRSRDGGITFVAMDRGLPPTLVLDLAISPNEELLFAATEAGPYVYVFDEGKWYELAQECTPAQTYWSVEYVPSLQIVRYGTYGRGIWDLQLEVDTPTPEPTRQIAGGRIFPNPTRGLINLSFVHSSGEEAEVAVWAPDGRRVMKVNYPPGVGSARLDLSHLPKGMYRLQLREGTMHYGHNVVIH